MAARGRTPAAAALAAALDRGVVAAPGPRQRWVWFNADIDAGLAAGPQLICQQSFRPIFLRLLKAGYRTVPEIGDGAAPYDGAIVFTGRHADLNRGMVARAWNRLRPACPLTVVGAKTEGIAPLRAEFQRRGAIAGNYAKHHAQLFWVLRESDSLPEALPMQLKDGYFIGAGMFSADGPDPGSAMLAECFDRRICGSVADLGAGWGYLGCRLAGCGGAIDKIDSFEADWRSLMAARRNITQRRPDSVGFHWRDLTTENVPGDYDWVVTNPPFHAGRTAQPEIGQAFLARAAAMLRPSGKLLLVANKSLPYERTLAQLFRRVHSLREDGNYKVYEAQR